jgi:cold shock CspA family protein
MRGTIRRIFPEKGFCFLIADRRDYFAHMSALINGDFYIASEGDPVDFDPVETPKGLRAERVRRL